MHIKFPKTVDNTLRYLRLKFLPKTLFFRTMLLIFIPLIVVQVVSIVAFFNGNWSRMGKKLSDNLTSDMAMVIDYSQGNPKKVQAFDKLAEANWDLNVTFYDNNTKHQFMTKASKHHKFITGFLEESLKNKFPDFDTNIYLTEDRDILWVLIDTPKGLYRFETSSKNIFTTAVFGFVAWMIGTSLLLFLVAVLFLRIQVRSIADLAQFSEDFGKGIDNKAFKPYGSAEVRKAGLAFIKMKERIQRQISERTRMLAGVSHDLRTPLTSISGNTSNLISNYDKLDYQTKMQMFTDIFDDSQWLISLVENLLSVTRIEENRMNFNMSVQLMDEVIEEAMRHINRKRNEHIISVECKDELLLARMDAKLIIQVIINIVDNAIKYTPAGSEIKITAEKKDNSVLVSIADNGAGIPDRIKPRVFEMFFTGDNKIADSRRSLGLGLSLCKSIINAHGSEITLTDNIPHGAVFTFSLPSGEVNINE